MLCWKRIHSCSWNDVIDVSHFVWMCFSVSCSLSWPWVNVCRAGRGYVKVIEKLYFFSGCCTIKQDKEGPFVDFGAAWSMSRSIDSGAALIFLCELFLSIWCEFWTEPALFDKVFFFFPFHTTTPTRLVGIQIDEKKIFPTGFSKCLYRWHFLIPVGHISFSTDSCNNANNRGYSTEICLGLVVHIIIGSLSIMHICL